jgi:transposase InsO family protein
LEKCPLVLADAQGTSIPVHGQCDVDIEIGGVKLRQRFIVADISSCLLIGSDLLFRHKAAIDFDSLALRVAGKWTRLNPLSESVSGVLRRMPVDFVSTSRTVASSSECIDARVVDKSISVVAACNHRVDSVCIGNRATGPILCIQEAIDDQTNVLCDRVVHCDVSGSREDRIMTIQQEEAPFVIPAGDDVAAKDPAVSFDVRSIPGVNDQSCMRGANDLKDCNAAYECFDITETETVSETDDITGACVYTDDNWTIYDTDGKVYELTEYCAVTPGSAARVRVAQCSDVTPPSGETADNVGIELPPERLAAMNGLLARCSERLTDEEREQVRTLLYTYADCFSISDDEMSVTDTAEHIIELTSDRPIKIPPRRLALAKREIVKREIDKWLKLGIIRESNSPYAAPIVLVERNGKSRLCIDYRELNKVTRKDALPMQRPEAIFDSLAGSKYFSVLDFRSCFLQVPVRGSDKHKTAFCTEDNLYEFNVLSFGMTNAPSCCVRMISNVFKGMSRDRLVAFIDDVMIHAVSVKQEIENLREAFSRLLKAKLKLNVDKCKLFQTSVSFLGHIVDQDGLRTDPKKVEAIVNWPTPRSASEVRSMVGLIQYYKRHIPECGRIAKPLYDLTRKRVRFVWGPEQQNAFDTLKERLVTAPVLALPTPDGEWVLDTDASSTGIGAVLSQRQNGQERVIAYFSRVLSSTERNYCVTRLELLAMVKAISHFHVYLYGRRFTLRTDHSSLTWLYRFREPEGQMARWLERLQNYDFEIVHRAGTKHGNADGLSRRPCAENNCRYCSRAEEKESLKLGTPAPPSLIDSNNAAKSIPLDDIGHVINSAPRASESDRSIDLTGASGCVSKTPASVRANETEASVCESESRGSECMGETECMNKTECDSEAGIAEAEMREFAAARLVRIQGTDLAAAQRFDDVLGSIFKAKTDGTSRPKWSDISARCVEYKQWWGEWEALEIKDGILCRRWVSDVHKTDVYLPAVPASLQPVVLQQVHDGAQGGHFGREKTLQKLKALYYWPQRRRSVVVWCANCKLCAARKGPKQRQKGPMQIYHVGAPMERLAVDILGPLPVTESGNKYLLVAVDHFTKWPEAVPLPNQEAATIAEALMTHVFSKFGVCAELFSDQGANFESRLIAEVCKVLGMHKTHSSSYFPCSNGVAESFNRTLLQSLSMIVSDNQRDWDKCVDLVLFSYRCARHASTGVSPCEAMLGRQLRGPVELLLPRPETESMQCGISYVDDLRSRLRCIHERVCQQLELTGLDVKRRYDRKSDVTGYQAGDAVYLYSPHVKRGLSPKLARKWHGPFKVIERLTDVVYRVQQSPKGRIQTVNRYRLHRFNQTLPERWFEDGVTVADPAAAGLFSSSPSISQTLAGHDPETEKDESADEDDSSGNDDDTRYHTATNTTRSGRPVIRPNRYRLD